MLEIKYLEKQQRDGISYGKCFLLSTFKDTGTAIYCKIKKDFLGRFGVSLALFRSLDKFTGQKNV